MGARSSGRNGLPGLRAQDNKRGWRWLCCLGGDRSPPWSCLGQGWMASSANGANTLAPRGGWEEGACLPLKGIISCPEAGTRVGLQFQPSCYRCRPDMRQGVEEVPPLTTFPGRLSLDDLLLGSCVCVQSPGGGVASLPAWCCPNSIHPPLRRKQSRTLQWPPMLALRPSNRRWQGGSHLLRAMHCAQHWVYKLELL